jgi:hypothetical protein
LAACPWVISNNKTVDGANQVWYKVDSSAGKSAGRKEQRAEKKFKKAEKSS